MRNICSITGTVTFPESVDLEEAIQGLGEAVLDDCADITVNEHTIEELWDMVNEGDDLASDWQAEVANGDTLRGFAAYVAYRKETDDEENE